MSFVVDRETDPQRFVASETADPLPKKWRVNAFPIGVEENLLLRTILHEELDTLELMPNSVPEDCAASFLKALCQLSELETLHLYYDGLSKHCHKLLCLTPVSQALNELKMCNLMLSSRSVALLARGLRFNVRLQIFTFRRVISSRPGHLVPAIMSLESVPEIYSVDQAFRPIEIYELAKAMMQGTIKHAQFGASQQGNLEKKQHRACMKHFFAIKTILGLI